MTTLHDISRSTLVAAATLERLARGSLTGIGPLDALAEGDVVQIVPWEHAAGTRPPLVEHAYRAVAVNLAGLETFDDGAFPSLTADERASLISTLAVLDRFGLVPIVRLALLLLDFAKGGSAARREAWSALGADLTVHNVAAATILTAQGDLDALDVAPVLRDLLTQLVATHGLAGQYVRGETPTRAFEPWVNWLRAHAMALGAVLGVTSSQAVTLAGNTMHMVDVLDTEAVRPGLVNTRILNGLRDMRDLWIGAVIHPEQLDQADPLRARFRRLRNQSIRNGEPVTHVDQVLSGLGEHGVWLEAMLRGTQLWYFEPATHRLSSEAAARLLLLALGQAAHADAVDTTQMFHVSFQPLVATLGEADARTTYRARLIETLLADTPLEVLRRGELPGTWLAAFLPKIGGTTAVALEVRMSEEADALVTLLALYQDRSSVAFHQILKLLCDAYGLRKDEFDRLANEANYLTTMNAARSDKERMLDYVVPGTIVEIGPGGGVILDLLAARFPESEVIGLDVSRAVVNELHRRQQVEQCRWTVVEGDAFELSNHVAHADTVILCSLLHEISSYIPYDGKLFQLEPVRDLLRACWATLRPGGRIVIRDGVRPPPGVRTITFLDPAGPDFLRRFQAEFEGLAIEVTWLDERTARMPSAHAMEFLYCYTWGAASYPYEVRELYGLLERDAYEAAVLGWLEGARAIELPADLRSYLQRGYIDGLANKIALTDGEGVPVALPDSNALLVFEKSAV